MVNALLICGMWILWNVLAEHETPGDELVLFTCSARCIMMVIDTPGCA